MPSHLARDGRTEPQESAVEGSRCVVGRFSSAANEILTSRKEFAW
jgi:hypothetical protein